ncbi:MAG: hypothetical protein HQL11_06365, partial [Candidatus Omnitrophica bacterium]|nr:hypothetical protein [Candidatus Omnitrophota bacterium]
MARLVERLEALEKKTDLVLSHLSTRAAVPASPPNEPAHHPPRPHGRTWYEAVCSACGKLCEVPFQPTGERPVYCKVCFAARKTNRPPQGAGTPVTPAPAPAPTPAPQPAKSVSAVPKSSKPAKTVQTS